MQSNILYSFRIVIIILFDDRFIDHFYQAFDQRLDLRWIFVEVFLFELNDSHDKIEETLPEIHVDIPVFQNVSIGKLKEDLG